MKPFFHRIAYAAMAAGLLACTLPGFRAQAEETAPVASDSRVKTFVFNENDVYNLLTYYGFQSNVEFGPKEKIETVSIGDRAGWQVVPAGRRLFIRAVADNLHTNMTVVTNLHAYQFDLRATNPANLPEEELVYVIRFFYPDDAKNQSVRGDALVPPASAGYPVIAASAPAMPPYSTLPAAPVASATLAAPSPVTTPPAPPASLPTAPLLAPAQAATPLAETIVPPPAPVVAQPLPAPAPDTASGGAMRYGAGPFDTPLPAASQSSSAPFASPALAPMGAPAAPRPTNYNYTYTGNGAVIPKAVFDNGQNTFLEFNTNEPAPEIYVWQASANNFVPAQTRQDQQYTIIPTVTSRLMLRRNGQVAMMYNETLP